MLTKTDQPEQTEVLVVLNNNYIEKHIDNHKEHTDIRPTTAKYRSYSSISRTYEDTIERNHSAVSTRVVSKEKTKQVEKRKDVQEKVYNFNNI